MYIRIARPSLSAVGLHPQDRHACATRLPQLAVEGRTTLPLNEGEVVLTFDDGPLWKHSEQVLEILASQCVKATFFMVGRQAQANPQGVRKAHDAGHTIATHTLSHPYAMQHLSIDPFQTNVE